MTTETCQTCNKTHPWPDGTEPVHPFNPGGLRGSQALRKPERKAPEVRVAPWPFDPVLRQALIDKGVLTPDDLQAAETKIRAVTAAFEQEAADGS